MGRALSNDSTSGMVLALIGLLPLLVVSYQEQPNSDEQTVVLNRCHTRHLILYLHLLALFIGNYQVPTGAVFYYIDFFIYV